MSSETVDKKNVLKTGTTTLGIVCKDGIVLAADRRATMGNIIADKKAQKIHKITDNIALTIAGTVSDAQLLIKLIQAETRLKHIKSGRDILVKEAANFSSRLIYQNIRQMSMIPGITQFVMGGKDMQGYHLYDLFVDGSITESDEYVSSGSGSTSAYAVLETMYKKDLSVDEGVTLALAALNAALARDSASGSGYDIISITEKGITHVKSEVIDTTIKA